MPGETSPPARPIYHSPTSFGHGRRSRSSSKRSMASSTYASTPTNDAPRTLCPPDGDAFSYQPEHLPAWYVPQELWDRLPRQLQTALAAMQHAGAAVLTGFERLEQRSETVDFSNSPKARADEMMAQPEDSIPAMPNLPPMLRTNSTASSFFEDSVTSSMVLESPTSTPGSPSLSMSSQPVSPISPMASPWPEVDASSKRSRERSFSTPLEPNDSYYATELSQLRTESLPRLRHAARKIDTAYSEVKRNGIFASSDTNDFENWWANKKCRILELNAKGMRLSDAFGVTSNGMGWTAP